MRLVLAIVSESTSLVYDLEIVILREQLGHVMFRKDSRGQYPWKFYKDPYRFLELSQRGFATVI